MKPSDKAKEASVGDRDVEQILKEDLSAGTDEFREALLQRCLAALGDDEGAPIADEDLDMLAAAGDIFAGWAIPPKG